ncbi:MAG: hypothetical protein SNJ55_00985 [Chloroherpetonaceae bacterium]
MDANQRISDLEAILSEYIAQNTLAQRRFEAESKQFREEMLAFKEELRRDTQAFKEEVRRDTQAFKEEVRRDTQALKEEMLAFKEELQRDTQAFKEEVRRDTQALKEEMRAFKEELRRDTQAFKEEVRRDTQALKEEMRAFKEDMQVFKEEMRAFKEDMRAFKEDMRSFKVYVENSIKENNKQWGGLANKLGTIVEDLIFPASRPVVESVFGVTIQQLSMRVIRRNNELKEEFDVIALSEKQLFLIEVKSTPRFDYLTDFVERKIGVFRQLFPEYASMSIVPIFASISIPDDFIRTATNRKVFVMAYRAWEYMDILNAKELLSQS